MKLSIGDEYFVTYAFKKILLAICVIVVLFAVSAQAGKNYILNSGFESGVTNWMPLDGWLSTAIYDNRRALMEKPAFFNDGLIGTSIPQPRSARVTEQKYEGDYSCRLDKAYEVINSAYTKLDNLPGKYTVSLWMKSTVEDADVDVMIVSAERTKGYPGKGIGQFSKSFKVAADWQRYSFSCDLPMTKDNRYQLIIHLPSKYEGQPVIVENTVGDKIDLRKRINPEKVYIDAVQLEAGQIGDYKVAKEIEVGASILDTDDWVFYKGQVPELEIQSGSKNVSFFKVRVEDIDRKTVFKKTIQADSPSVKIPLKIEGTGYFRAFVRAYGSDKDRSDEVELPFGIVHRPDENVNAKDSSFGALFAVTRSYQNKDYFKPGQRSGTYELDDRQIKTAKKVGLRWVKALDWILFTTWPDTEPKRGAFQFGDAQVRFIKKYGFEIYGKWKYVPRFAQRPEYKGRHKGPPADMEAWDNYVRKSLEHYKGDLNIDHWAVWAEPFTTAFWKGTAEEHFDLTKRTFDIARKIRPDVKLGILNASSPYYRFQNKTIIKDIVRTGELNYGDIFTFHRPQNYSYEDIFMPEEMKPSWADEIDIFREWMDEYGKGQMPMWNTEFRHTSESGYLDKDRFAFGRKGNVVCNVADSINWVVRGQAVSIANGIEKTFVHSIGPCGWNYDRNSWQEMKEPDGRPTPWMIAFAGVTHMLEGVKPAGQVKLHDRVRCYLFEKGPDTVAVIWGLFTEVSELQKEGPGEITLKGNCKVIDVMGNTIAEGEKITVELRARPYYVVFEDTSFKNAAEIVKNGEIKWFKLY